MRYSSNTFITDQDLAWEKVAPGIKRKIMSYDDHLMLVKVEFEAGAVGAAHQHFHSQTSYVVAGEFEVTIGDETTILRTGEVFYVQPNILHGAIALTNGMLLDIFSPIREDFMAAAGLLPAAAAAS
ncbi:cupin domain-containing protein [Hymenobacter artigasi]|uniref:Quercetin dioxygenase-like cupin family protein n=1 Tax=Hymenobacter artigasi TaxID=2719616 RepID=A0ABX1HL88_9BACT|nr:cupin domain-containing protein [Hymenobacter artigasi]NKI90980.1 quercetin dioxygenase-like cupin family protein [Hymenobacter artigasi]